MRAVLVHGMGRTPASQLLLALRLERLGLTTHLFGYGSRSRFEPTVERLVRRVKELAHPVPFVLVGHSLGSVLIRAALPRLAPLEPAACFFLAPPATACRAARFFSGNPLYRLFSGEMGRLLADDAFMRSLPVPTMPYRVHAGTAGPRGGVSPFGDEPNDGVLALSETRIGDAPVVEVKAIHTFIMNAASVAEEIAALSLSLDAGSRP